MIFGKLGLGLALFDHLPRVRVRVEVEHAERLVPALHRHADGLADAEPHDALTRGEAVVAGGIRHQNALLFAQDVLHDSPANADLFVPADAPAIANRLRLELPSVRVAQHHATTVGLD